MYYLFSGSAAAFAEDRALIEINVIGGNSLTSASLAILVAFIFIDMLRRHSARTAFIALLVTLRGVNMIFNLALVSASLAIGIAEIKIDMCLRIPGLSAFSAFKHRDGHTPRTLT